MSDVKCNSLHFEWVLHWQIGVHGGRSIRYCIAKQSKSVLKGGPSAERRPVDIFLHLNSVETYTMYDSD